MSALGLNSALPPIDAAREPANIRNGTPAAKQAYQEALGFEDVLVQQLTKELAATVSSPSQTTSSDGSDGSSSGSGGILGSDASTNAFASMIPTTLTSSIMSGGGLGIAEQLAQAIDPSIGAPPTPASTGTAKPSTSTGKTG